MRAREWEGAAASGDDLATARAIARWERSVRTEAAVLSLGGRPTAVDLAGAFRPLRLEAIQKDVSDVMEVGRIPGVRT